MTNWLLLGVSAKEITQDQICKLRLPLFCFFRPSPYLFPIFVINDDRFIVFRKRPKTDVAVKATPLASRAFRVIALFAQRLPVVLVIRASTRTRNSVVRGKFDGWFRLTTMCTGVSTLFFQAFPKFFYRFCTRFSFSRNLRRCELVLRSFLNYAGKSFLALQFSHSSEWVNIRFLSIRLSNFINDLPNFTFTDLRARNAMPIRPELMQQDGIDFFERRSVRNKPNLSVIQPFFPSLRIGNGVGSWREQ